MVHKAFAALSGGLFLAASVSGCWLFRGLGPDGEAQFSEDRRLDAVDIALPEGFRAEIAATGLAFPVSVGFDELDRVYVVEAGYSYGEAFAIARLLRVSGGQTKEVARGGNGPWNGLSWADGAFYLGEGGELQGGRIVRVSLDGTIKPVVEGLPGRGDHPTSGPAIGPDGWIYFGQGTRTNSGVVGEDNFQFGWLKRFPNIADVPCQDVTLAGENFTSTNPLTENAHDQAVTGAFLPFGTPSKPGQVIRGQVPCSGSIMRVKAEGGKPELVAWGFRNPFGLAFSPDGKLFVTDNGFDVRGSRPIWGAADHLFEVKRGAWYGWPDFSGGRPLGQARFQPLGRPLPKPLLVKNPGTPPEASAYFGVHSSSSGFSFSTNADFGYQGQAFVAQFGDLTPGTGRVLSPVGFKVVRMDPGTGTIADFAVNRQGTHGPASRVGGGGLERPVDAKFDRTGKALYVVDFGVMAAGPGGVQPRKGTGVLWRIVREGGKGERGGESMPEGPSIDSPAPERGQRIFMKHCNECHPGTQAGLGPSLQPPLPGAAIRLVVRSGPGTLAMKGILPPMPAFGKAAIGDAALDDLIAYLKAARAAK